MSQLIFSLVCCWAQVLVVAAIATLLSRLAMRQSPATGAAIAVSGVLTAVALTLLAVVPSEALAQIVPILWHEQRNGDGTANDTAQINTGEIASQTKPSTAGTDAEPRIALGLSVFRRTVGSLRRSESTLANQRGIVGFVGGMLAVASMIGVARLLYGVWAISALGRASRSVSDPRIAAVLKEIRPHFGNQALPPVKESDQIANAAVVGCWRQAIILSSEWREWSSAELKAVLAHEWAHVVRRDYACRIVASLCVAMQCLQPLVYWLRRQLVLTQELAADELAAAAIGSRAEYLRALVQITLRQDQRPIGGPMEMLLPVFSGFFMRRIEMLRAKDCSLPRPLWQGSAIALVIAISLATTALRGLAQPPEKDEDGSIRVATANKTVPRPAAEQNNPRAEDLALFQRPPFDITKLPLSKQGGFLLRLGEILKQPRFAGMAREQNETIVNFLNTFSADVEAPALALEDIDYIAGDFVLSAKFVPEPKEGRTPHEVMFGTSCVFVRWHTDVNALFEALLRIPDTARKTHDEIAFVELPLIPAMAPVRTCVAKLDANTLIWVGGDEEALFKRLDQLATSGEGQPWHSAWPQGDGGLVTAVAAKPEFKYPPDAELDETAQFTEDLFAKAHLVTLIADWHGTTDSDLALRLRLRCESEADATATRNGIQRAMEGAEQEARKDADKAASSKEKAAAEILAEFLKQGQIETRETDGGWEISMRFSGPIDVRSVFP